MATYSISNAFKRSTTTSDPHSARGFSIFCAFAMKEFLSPFTTLFFVRRTQSVRPEPLRTSHKKKDGGRSKTAILYAKSSILKFSGWLAFFHREATRPSGSASLAAPPVEQQSNRTSASRLENPPVSLDA